MCDTKRPARNSKVKAKLTELEEIFTTTSNDMEWQHIRTEALYTLSKEQGKAVRKKRDKTGRVNRLDIIGKNTLIESQTETSFRVILFLVTSIILTGFNFVKSSGQNNFKIFFVLLRDLQQGNGSGNNEFGTRIIWCYVD
ncbi:hypothetical protein RhiirA1_439517 [Rhizophagus irregularis]|uniref:Uncharacterized protein n=2 Tax=Rhizophagus irregularis TaxID=588596 RepID=A0A2N0S409_9GLOM|nr:hypothetical protein GLOIN_2v1842379 [Rhizophagus irregularis DAOM 181602=DAOM 197198]PKC70280.1 hypothetical protein RhiirA1_439517 [Rhizophagus irregularis]POG69472.1 hypothetical protein GLOIN_2v1842379 [Rhizophagus irregularis DAOM 181602=DAOM 197198]GBC32249.2 hypothetical protein GLOIN_2v1842379 [Rhizophagus irregularis DAOM 181602=DAOM 197198]|eukprot:XP_025176338.1 hypothetical protein GLOIN_2v1842379 [Rhizophagus irregularis DAOM 181602=DAOM 197198]